MDAGHEQADDQLDRVLAYNVSTRVRRRRALGLLAGVTGTALLSPYGLSLESNVRQI